MKQELKYIALLITAAASAAFAFAGGLTLMNVRADWALALGGLLCVAALALGVVFVTRLIAKGEQR